MERTCSARSFLHLVVAGKYVDLSELLSVNIVQSEPKSHVLLYGRFIFFYFFFGHDIIFPASMGEHFCHVSFR